MDFSALINPQEFTTSLALLIGILLSIVTFMGVKLRSAIIMFSLSLSVIVFLLVVMINLSFIWFWTTVLLSYITVLIASIYYFNMQ